jgi:hypothetical protein
VATLIPPRDVRNHGTRPGPYSLILLGDDMLLFDRDEYDPGLGTWRALRPVIPAARTADPASDERRAVRSAAARKKGPK